MSAVHLISREPIWLQNVSTARECMVLIAVIYYSVVLWWKTVTLQLTLKIWVYCFWGLNWEFCRVLFFRPFCALVVSKNVKTNRRNLLQLLIYFNRLLKHQVLDCANSRTKGTASKNPFSRSEWNYLLYIICFIQ